MLLLLAHGLRGLVSDHRSSFSVETIRGSCQGVSTRVGISKKHADLTIFNPSSRSTVLSLHADRCDAFFQKTCLIDDHHRVGSRKSLQDICTQFVSHASSATCHPFFREASLINPWMEASVR